MRIKTFIILIYMTFTQQLLAASFCDAYKLPASYIEIKSKVDEKIRIFSNKKSIASRADDTLSKLISAKSPIIAGWMTKRNLNTNSEEAIVREWRDYYARNFILTRYPHGDISIDSEIESLMTNINQLFSNKKFQDKIETLFKKAQIQSISTIHSMPINDESKKKIISRIEAIKIYWMKDFKISKFKQLPLEFLDWGIAYDPAANEINVGVNSLAYPNDETYLAVFAHEIGHSFDSCRWSAYFSGSWPFQKIGECLRSSKSVAAKTRDDSKLELLAKENKELAESLKANPTCNKILYPPVGLQADQLPESFADWFSAEAMAQINSINKSSIRSDLCEKKELHPGSSYPPNDLRLNAIYFAHPQLKKANDDKEPHAFTHCWWN